MILKVEAIAIEGGDTLNRWRGPLMTNPHVVGYQAAGEIVAVGAEVTHLKLGQKVATVNNWGSHAELLDKGGLYARFWARQSGGFIGTEDAA